MWRCDICERQINHAFPIITGTKLAVVILSLLVLSAASIISSLFHFTADAGCPICKSGTTLLAGSSNSAAFLDPQEIPEKNVLSVSIVLFKAFTSTSGITALCLSGRPTRRIPQHRIRKRYGCLYTLLQKTAAHQSAICTDRAFRSRGHIKRARNPDGF